MRTHKSVQNRLYRRFRGKEKSNLKFVFFYMKYIRYWWDTLSNKLTQLRCPKPAIQTIFNIIGDQNDLYTRFWTKEKSNLKFVFFCIKYIRKIKGCPKPARGVSKTGYTAGITTPLQLSRVRRFKTHYWHVYFTLYQSQ